MSSGVYKVERIVDTVRIEMDIDVAEQLLEVLNQVDDSGTRFYDPAISKLRARLELDAEVRTPSALYIADVSAGNVYLRRTTSEEFDIRKAARDMR